MSTYRHTHTETQIGQFENVSTVCPVDGNLKLLSGLRRCFRCPLGGFGVGSNPVTGFSLISPKYITHVLLCVMKNKGSCWTATIERFSFTEHTSKMKGTQTPNMKP